MNFEAPSSEEAVLNITLNPYLYLFNANPSKKFVSVCMGLAFITSHL